ncbi:uncharacterized protein LOC134832031 [Culicoides brevitarsis]|uniref:uncharacterized protein LOC134832031 n=1 Tax=Culicoides brevitarsis TaxID=469753 RepID=UPI00307C53EF
MWRDYFSRWNCCFCIDPRRGVIALGIISLLLRLVRAGLLTSMNIVSLLFQDEPYLEFLRIDFAFVIILACAADGLLVVGAIKEILDNVKCYIYISYVVLTYEMLSSIFLVAVGGLDYVALYIDSVVLFIFNFYCLFMAYSLYRTWALQTRKHYFDNVVYYIPHDAENQPSLNL